MVYFHEIKTSKSLSKTLLSSALNKINRSLFSLFEVPLAFEEYKSTNDSKLPSDWENIEQIIVGIINGRFENSEMGDSNTKPSNIMILTALEQIVFNLNEKNLEFLVQQTMNLFDANLPYSFNLAICMLVYAAFSSLWGGFNTYLSLKF